MQCQRGDIELLSCLDLLGLHESRDEGQWPFAEVDRASRLPRPVKRVKATALNSPDTVGAYEKAQTERRSDMRYVELLDDSGDGGDKDRRAEIDAEGEQD